MNATSPRTPRRSFIYRELEAAGARFVAIGDAEVAARYAGGDETQALIGLGIADLSPLPTGSSMPPKGRALPSARRPTTPSARPMAP